MSEGIPKKESKEITDMKEGPDGVWRDPNEVVSDVERRQLQEEASSKALELMKGKTKEEVVSLMNELNTDDKNRYLVEELGRQLSIRDVENTYNEQMQKFGVPISHNVDVKV